MKVGFIGNGNMGGALLGGMMKHGYLTGDQVWVSSLNQHELDMTKERYGANVTMENAQVAKEVDLLFLAVKPQFYQQVIDDIKDVVDDEMAIVTMAPGWTLERIAGAFGKKLQIVRTMPNTPALVGEGNIVVSPGSFVTKERLDQVMKGLACCGKATIIPEYLQDAAVAVSGSSPAYVFMMIEAMADAAVADGMPRKQAYEFAAQAVYGSAKMVLETGKHPGELKDMVCSPAGTTIEAVRVLERTGFRSSIMEGMKACTDKIKGL